MRNGLIKLCCPLGHSSRSGCAWRSQSFAACPELRHHHGSVCSTGPENSPGWTKVGLKGPPGGEVSTSPGCEAEVSQALVVQSPQRHEQAVLNLTLSHAFTAVLTATASMKGMHIESLCSQGTRSGTKQGTRAARRVGNLFVQLLAAQSHHGMHAAVPGQS